MKQTIYNTEADATEKESEGQQRADSQQSKDLFIDYALKELAVTAPIVGP